MTGTCDDCAYNVYDDEMDEYVCEAYLDDGRILPPDADRQKLSVLPLRR